jgi:hypothetical protein
MRLPAPPDLRDAACRRFFIPDMWASGDPEDREAARHVCLTTCPVLEACRAWSLTLPLDVRGTIAGLGQSERQQIRRQQREAAKAQAAKLERQRELQREYRRRSEKLRRMLGKTPSDRERYARNPEPRKAASRAYYQRHKAEVNARQRERRRAARATRNAEAALA